ncbi:MAG TPA: hypothetical protein PKA64_02835 [Myxococcota bacterium]|nr:hypothetical protein [Myxococcota bacterium]
MPAHNPDTYAAYLDSLADAHHRLALAGGPASERHHELAEDMRAMAHEARDPRSLLGR